MVGVRALGGWDTYSCSLLVPPGPAWAWPHLLDVQWSDHFQFMVKVIWYLIYIHSRLEQKLFLKRILAQRRRYGFTPDLPQTHWMHWIVRAKGPAGCPGGWWDDPDVWVLNCGPELEVNIVLRHHAMEKFTSLSGTSKLILALFGAMKIFWN